MLLTVPIYAHGNGLYYTVKKDGTLCITDAPTSAQYKPYTLKKTINYIRNAIIAFRRDKRSVQEIEPIVHDLCQRYGVDKNLVMAVIDVESGFDAAAVSTAGAQGLMQIMPGTGKDLNLIDPYNPTENIDAGIRYLRQLLDKFPDRRLAIAAYNAGPNAVTKYGGIPPYNETQDYVNKVCARLENYE
ncbi:MAG: lytic transglycosylase domain-containing protein [Desulfovibrionales bacterium]|nr:lytic transglycosylase domain-containing protein [Desulfovibrionales bacterium]